MTEKLRKFLAKQEIDINQKNQLDSENNELNYEYTTENNNITNPENNIATENEITTENRINETKKEEENEINKQTNNEQDSDNEEENQTNQNSEIDFYLGSTYSIYKENTTEAETKMIVLDDNRIAEAVELEGELVEKVDAEGKQVLVVSKDLKNLLSGSNPDPILEDKEQQKILDEMLILKLNEQKEFSWKWILLGAVVISGIGALTEAIRYRRIWKA